MKRMLLLLALIVLLAGLAYYFTVVRSAEEASPVVANWDDPLMRAKPGQWALYEVMGGNQQKFTVVEVEKDQVSVRIETFMEGRRINQERAQYDLPRHGPGYQEPGKPPVIKGRATLEVAGQKIECTTYKKAEHGSPATTWFSPQIPIHGIVRYERGDQVVMKLLKWGE